MHKELLLLRLAQAVQTDIKSPRTFARLVSANLMHRRRIDMLRKTPPPVSQNINQYEFQWVAA